MVERLDLFRSRSNKLPGRILVYRDGVSEVGFAYLSPVILHRVLLRFIGPVFDCCRRRAACNKSRVQEVQHGQRSLPTQINYCYLCRFF